MGKSRILKYAFPRFSYQAGLSDRDLPELAWKRQLVPNIVGDLALSAFFSSIYLLLELRIAAVIPASNRERLAGRCSYECYWARRGNCLVRFRWVEISVDIAA